VYSPFSAYPFGVTPLQDPLVRYTTSRYQQRTGKEGVTEAQVLLRWALDKGFAVIPRSQSPERLEENLGAVVLPPLSRQESALLDTLQFLVASPASVPVLA